MNAWKYRFQAMVKGVVEFAIIDDRLNNRDEVLVVVTIFLFFCAQNTVPIFI